MLVPITLNIKNTSRYKRKNELFRARHTVKNQIKRKLWSEMFQKKDFVNREIKMNVVNHYIMEKRTLLCMYKYIWD